MKIWHGYNPIGLEQNPVTLASLTASKLFLNPVLHVVVVLDLDYENNQNCPFQDFVRAVLVIEPGELVKVMNEPNNAYLSYDKSIPEMITDDSFTWIQFIAPLNTSPVFIIPDEPAAQPLRKWAKDIEQYSGTKAKTVIDVVLNFIKSLDINHEGSEFVTIVETA